MTYYHPDDEDDTREEDWIPGFYAGPGPGRPPMESWTDTTASHGYGASRTRFGGRPRPIAGGYRRRRPRLLAGALITGGVVAAAFVSYGVLNATPASNAGPVPAQSSSAGPSGGASQGGTKPASASASAKPSSHMSPAGPSPTPATTAPSPTYRPPSPSYSSPGPEPSRSHGDN